MVRQKIYLMNGFYKSYMVNHLVIYYIYICLTNHYYMAFISLIWLVQTKTHIGGYGMIFFKCVCLFATCGSLYQTSIRVMDVCIYIYMY